MKAKDELFLLVKSLDKNEKGYFRKFSGLHGSKDSGDYMRLFDCLSKMREYDEKVLKAEFKGEKILSHLSVTKHYLKNQIIRALRNYQEGKTGFIRDLLALADTYVLMSKSLFKAASKKISKEKQSSLARESFLQTLQWLTVHERMLTMTGNFAEKKSNAQQRMEEKRKLAAQYLNYHEYNLLLNILTPLMIMKTGAKEFKQLDEVAKNPLLSSSKMPLSNHARVLYTEVQTRVYQLKNEREKAVPFLKEQIAWFEDPKNRAYISPFNRFVQINLLLSFMSRAEVAEKGPLIEKGRKLASDKSNSLTLPERDMIQTIMYWQEINMNLLMRKHGTALHLIAQLEKHFKNVSTLKEEEISLCLLRAMVYVGLKQFDKALSQLNLIFSADLGDTTEALINAYLLNVVTHIELGNYSILKRQNTIATNFIKKNYPTRQNELKLFKELAEFAKVLQRRDRKAIKIKAGVFLKTFKSKKMADKEYFEDWVESKI